MVYFLRYLENSSPNLSPTKIRCTDKSNYPPQSPLVKGGSRKSSSLPFTRGGLGWGKNQIRKLLQTCVYTIASTRREALNFPHSLAGKGAGGLGHFPHNVRG